MSRYGVNKVLWQVARDEAAALSYARSAEAFLAGRDLTEAEHEQLLGLDYAALLASGANPHLLYTFHTRTGRGPPRQQMLDYVAAVAQVAPPLDITT